MATKDKAIDPRREILARQVATAPPPLEGGDRLTRREFERRYQAMPRVRKAELIEGVVYMPTPVHAGAHGRPHGQIMSWLGAYCAATPGVDLLDNASVRLDIDNEVQPDALLRLEPAAGGRSHISQDDYVEGPPELIVEIAGSSASIDLRDKLRVYQRNGVQEYIVWQVYDKRVDWFHLVEDEYTPLTLDESGVIRSPTFPGLHLAVSALLEGDLAKVLSQLQAGLDTTEHAEFAKRLTEKKQSQ
jgi:Uma2 family endonuclease